jgi:hypothetical protein
MIICFGGSWFAVCSGVWPSGCYDFQCVSQLHSVCVCCFVDFGSVVLWRFDDEYFYVACVQWVCGLREFVLCPEKCKWVLKLGAMIGDNFWVFFEGKIHEWFGDCLSIMAKSFSGQLLWCCVDLEYLGISGFRSLF